MSFIDDVAFALHEKWREKRYIGNGAYEPSWKKINDVFYIYDLEQKAEFSLYKFKKYLPSCIRQTEEENEYEIDIANASYNLLPKHLQKETINIADDAVYLLKLGQSRSREEIGNIMHKAWLDKNQWAKGGELDVPFSELPVGEQERFLMPYDIANTMYKAKVETKYINTLDGVVKFLEEQKKENNNVAYKFNGKMLYSEFDTKESCYLKVTDKTVQEYQANSKLDKELFENIEKWEKCGKELVYPEKKSKWNSCVNDRATGFFKGEDIECAIKIMDALEAGKSVEEATQLVNPEDMQEIGWNLVSNVVTNFSKRGPEFYRYNNENLSAKEEKYLQILENENKQYEENAQKNVKEEEKSEEAEMQLDEGLDLSL